MDSINQNQPEHNRENLIGTQAVNKIKELAEKASSCFFSTTAIGGQSSGTRPMSVQKIDKEGTLWFVCASDSNCYEEVAADPSVKLYFQGSHHSDFLYLNTTARLTTDKNKIKELWDPTMKAWFTEGENDPRIVVIEVTPEEGYYWDTKHGNAVAAVKMLIGAALGKTLDDSIEGKIKL